MNNWPIEHTESDSDISSLTTFNFFEEEKEDNKVEKSEAHGPEIHEQAKMLMYNVLIIKKPVADLLECATGLTLEETTQQSLQQLLAFCLLFSFLLFFLLSF